MKIQDQFIGCMVGSALGDSIGEIVLYRAGMGFISLHDLDLLIDRETLLHDIQDFQQLKYTDDTHMAIGIAEALSSSHILDLNEIKRRFLVNYQAEPGRGYGIGTSAILSLVTHERMAYDEAVRYVNDRYIDGSRGNGSVMRTHPVALRFYDSHNLYNISSQIAALTHRNPVAQDAAAILTYGIAYLLRLGDQEFSPFRFLQHICKIARTPTMQEKLHVLYTTISEEVEPTM